MRLTSMSFTKFKENTMSKTLLSDKQVMLIASPLFLIAHFYITGCVLLILAAILDYGESLNHDKNNKK